MNAINSMDSDQAKYWNEAGGRRWAENIERVERMLEPLTAQLLAQAAPQAGERVLDIGCGGGRTSAAFANAVGEGGEVLGLDVSAVILDVARARYRALSHLRFAQGDAGSMALPARHYDAMVSRFGVMFFPDASGAFRHLRQALKPDGRLVFICWQALTENPWMAVPVQAAFQVLPKPEPQPPTAPGPFAFANPDHLRAVLESAGFGDIELISHRQMLSLGTVEDAVQQMTRMGPSAPAFADATSEQQAAAVNAITHALTPHLKDDGVQLPSATWVVRARPVQA